MNQLRKKQSPKEEHKTGADIIANRKPSGPQLIERVRAVQPIDIHSGDGVPLFSDNELQDLYVRWDKVQATLTDNPRQAAQQARTLVTAAIKRLGEQFAERCSQLEMQWKQGEAVSPEDVRQALLRHRAFFDRLLSFSVAQDSVVVDRDIRRQDERRIGPQVVREAALNADEVSADGEQYLQNENGAGFA